MTDRYADWDASYVLGALSPAERREYERHLETCPRCAEAVAEVAGLPSLLARVPIEEVPGESAESPQSDLVAGALAKHRIRRRRRRWTAVAIGSLTAAAAAIVLVVVVGVSGPAPSATAVTVELASTTQEALTADVRMQPRAWGTELSTRCRYTGGVQPTDPPAGGDPSSYSAETRYGLWVTDRAGVSSLVSTWRAEPGSDVDAAGATDVRLGDIRHLEIRSVDSGDVLLQSDVTAVGS